LLLFREREVVESDDGAISRWGGIKNKGNKFVSVKAWQLDLEWVALDGHESSLVQLLLLLLLGLLVVYILSPYNLVIVSSFSHFSSSPPLSCGLQSQSEAS
jgi:hypothetical protein